MEPESLSHSEERATCLYPEPDQTSPCPQPTSWRIILILFSHLCLGLPSGYLPSGLAAKFLYVPLISPILATCPANLGRKLHMNININKEWEAEIGDTCVALNNVTWLKVQCDHKIPGLDSKMLPPDYKLCRSAVCLMRYPAQYFRMFSEGEWGKLNTWYRWHKLQRNTHTLWSSAFKKT